MSTFYVRKMRSFAIAAAAIACVAVTQKPAAAASCTATCVTYTASGTFSSTVVKGNDTFKLAGQKFNISINNVPTTTRPFKTGTGWFAYNKLNMTGTVNSALDPTPITLVSSTASMELAIEQTKQLDVFTLYVPVKVLGLTFYILASINMPYNTITRLSIYPFNNTVTLNSTNNTVLYSYTPAGGTMPDTTTLTIDTGTVTTACTGTGCPAAPVKTASLDTGVSPAGIPGAAVLRAVFALPMRRQYVPALSNC